MIRSFIRFPSSKEGSKNRNRLGKRGAGMELAIVTLLIVTALSILIVSSAMGDSLSRKYEEGYTSRRVALTYMAEAFELAIRSEDLFSEEEFRNMHVFFNEIFPKGKTYATQGVEGNNSQFSYSITFYGEKGQTHLAVQIDKTATTNPTFRIVRWDINP